MNRSRIRTRGPASPQRKRRDFSTLRSCSMRWCWRCQRFCADRAHDCAGWTW